MATESQRAETIVLATVDGAYFEIPLDVFRSYRIEKPADSTTLTPTGMIFDVLTATEEEVQGFGLPVELPSCPVGHHLVVRQSPYHPAQFFCVPGRASQSLMDLLRGR